MGLQIRARFHLFVIKIQIRVVGLDKQSHLDWINRGRKFAIVSLDIVADVIGSFW